MFVAEYACRDMPPVDKESWKFEYPLFHVEKDEEAVLKSENEGKGGRPRKQVSVAAILESAGGVLPKSELQTLICREGDVGTRTAYRRIKEALEMNEIERVVATEADGN